MKKQKVLTEAPDLGSPESILVWSGSAYIWLLLLLVFVAVGCSGADQVGPVSSTEIVVSAVAPADTLEADISRAARDPKRADRDDCGLVPIDAIGQDTLDLRAFR